MGERFWNEVDNGNALPSGDIERVAAAGVFAARAVNIRK
jgi:hypothetical protein